MEVAPQRIWFTAEQTSAHWSDMARDKVQSGSLDIRIISDFVNYLLAQSS